MSTEPWQTAEIPGPIKAFTITKSIAVVGIVRKAKRIVMVVGHEAADTDIGGEKAIDYVIRIAKACQIPVVATAHVTKAFIERGFDHIYWMSAVDIANRLQDPEWEGLDGKGRYDLALFMGIPYYMQWTILSGLKHSAPYLRTISLDRFYQPHASWSFPNISSEEWNTYLKEILNLFEPKKQ